MKNCWFLLVMIAIIPSIVTGQIAADKSPIPFDVPESMIPLPVRHSLTGSHHSYLQYLYGYPVYGSRLDIHLDKSGNEVWRKDQTIDITNLDLIISSSIPLKENNSVQTNPVAYSESHAWIEYDNRLVLGEWVKTDPVLGQKDLMYEGISLATRSTKKFLHLPDSLVNAKVFLVNPLNTAEKLYKSSYVDSSDADIAVLNSERKDVKMITRFESDTFWLKSDRYYFGEVSGPSTKQTFTKNGNFDFTRSQYQFEDVNAWYHITSYSDYIESLGFSQLLPLELLIDAHAYNGGDLSSFNYEVDPLELEFGTGGVDDAEDGEVVIHEFGHALSFGASPGTAEGRERNSMEEGNCDYFSTTYSRQFTDFAWKQVFNWDGHNEFWNGINTGLEPGEKMYPEDLKNSTNSDRELWSSPLMCMYEKLGQGLSDTLVMEHLFYQTEDTKMPEMAKVILKIDTLLFKGENYYDIKECFVRYGILEWGSSVESLSDDIQIQVANTAGFARGTSPLMISSEHSEGSTLLLYDAMGRLMLKDNWVGQYHLEPEKFNSGVYFLHIQLNGTSTIKKVIRQ